MVKRYEDLMNEFCETTSYDIVKDWRASREAAHDPEAPQPAKKSLADILQDRGIALKFNKDQDRDVRGRFTDMGRGASQQDLFPPRKLNAVDAGPSAQEAKKPKEVDMNPIGLPPDGKLATFAAKYDDPNVTPEEILKKVPQEAQDEMRRLSKLAQELPQTIDTYSDGNGGYTAERRELHAKLLAEMFSPESIARATPKNGEAPKFTVLGGRGGSGKSMFTDGTIKEFDATSAITIDADHFKGGLKPPYEGWNAAQVHEESSYLMKQATAMAQKLGVNFIHDITLGSRNVEKVMDSVRERGYTIEGHYMHLPRQEAARRAVNRYLGKNGKRGRLVPPNLILDMKQNEANFDALRAKFDRWSMYDNQTGPRLIARS